MHILVNNAGLRARDYSDMRGFYQSFGLTCAQSNKSDRGLAPQAAPARSSDTAGRSSRLDADTQARLDQSGAKTGDVQIVLTWNNSSGTTLSLLVRLGRASLTLCDVMQVVAMTWTFTSNLQKTNGSSMGTKGLEEAI